MQAPHNTIEQALASVQINNNQITFPDRIEAPIFTKMKTMFAAITGTWLGKKAQAFGFDFDPSCIVAQYLSDGSWPKKNPFSLYPTPAIVTDYACKFTYADANRFAGYDHVIRILEPSAGRGDLIDAVIEGFKRLGIRYEVICVELDPVNIAILTGKGYTVIAGDFLSLSSLGEFDLVIMNPPFEGNNYTHHIRHAQGFLKKNGKLVAIAPTSIFKSPHKATVALRQEVNALNYHAFPGAIFEKHTFDDTTAETCVFELYAPERTKREALLMEDYGVNTFVLYINNLRSWCGKVQTCGSEAALRTFMPEMAKAYLDEYPFAFINDAIIEETIAFLVDFRQTEWSADALATEIAAPITESTVNPTVEHSTPVAKAPSPVKTEAFAKIDSLLTEISQTLKPSPRPKKRATPLPTRQLSFSL
jgi:hypothetical protein